MRLLTLDCSRSDALTLCTAPGCLFRAGPFTNRADAKAAADRHRALFHVKAAADAAYVRRRRAAAREQATL
jgi:hypothetical protein